MKYCTIVPISLFFLLAFSTTLEAQIPAPTLRCVRRDTLIWDVPAVACGTVTGYDIFAARNPNGPYQLLTTITNVSQTRYFFNNTEGGLWYFYLQTRANCAGQTPRSSDTLDNNPPELNPILTLNVVTNRTVEIRWRRNPSPEVVGYIVYKRTATGLVPIANVPSRDTLRYVDTNASAGLQSETYQVLAVDGCGNTSLFDQNHRTILLRAQQSKCDQSITLRWNLYQNWPNPIARHEILLSVNGRNPYVFASVAGTDTAFTFRNVTDRDRYTFAVRAIQGVTNIASRSNDTTVVADIIQPVKNLILTNVSVNAQNQVEVFWRWNSNAKVDSITIFRFNDSILLGGNRIKPTQPLDDGGTFVDNVNASNNRFFYELETKDDCGARVRSNRGATVLLKVAPQSNRRNLLTWSALEFPAGTVTGYQVIRIINGAATPIGLPLDTSTRQFADLAAPDEPNVCYRIGAIYRYSLPDNTTEEATSYSNTACAAQNTSFFMPNAFTPNGANPEFKPLINYADNIQSYTLVILDRWGGKIFESNDPSVGWTGKRGSNDLPQGAYSYFMRITQKNGSVVEDKGIVMLIR